MQRLELNKQNKLYNINITYSILYTNKLTLTYQEVVRFPQPFYNEFVLLIHAKVANILQLISLLI